MTPSLLLLPWLLPLLVLVLGVASGRMSISRSALAALLLSACIALMASPAPYAYAQLWQALLRGAWIGGNIAPYILGGILFWQAAASSAPPAEAHRLSPLEQRRHIFFACFLVGPFAEAATGFGVGMLGTIALIRHFHLGSRQVAVFALLSQTYIPWGAMGSGSVLAAAYARLPANELTLYASIPSATLMLVWLPLYWHTLKQAGLDGHRKEAVREVAWIALSLALLVLTTAYIGPETSLLAVFGALMAIRYVVRYRPTLEQLRTTWLQVAPHALLILALLISRLSPELKLFLENWGRWQAYPDLPGWSPFYHAGSLLILGALLCCVWRRRLAQVPALLASAWQKGSQAMISIILFAMMAEILQSTGTSALLATELFTHMQQYALLCSTLLASALGILTNSGNMPNSLLMNAQLSLATHLDLHRALVAGLLHGTGTCLSIFSPIRLSIACGLAQQAGQERQLYGLLLPYILAAMLLMLALAYLLL